jgi:hypothetical protein
MMEIADTRPDVQVMEAEYLRLLGYPLGHSMGDRAAELAAQARAWYAEHGRPWVYAREVEAAAVGVFHGVRLRESMRQADAQSAIVAAISAGPEAELEAQRLWLEEKPDEYFFLETYASAVTEHLTTSLGARLCAWAEAHGRAVLPHDSPGYPGWDVAEQPGLLELVRGKLPGPLETLESGGLRPKKSLMAVFGITGDPASVYRLRDGVPCVHCSYHPCRYRRAAYVRLNAYTVNARALERWCAERLRLRRYDDGTIEARFRYDGSTCTNMGRPLAFEYVVKLGPGEEGYPLREQHCAPVAGDTGHRAMCEYDDELMSAIDEEKPLAGRPLDEVLEWRRPSSPAGCYCEAASRDHKWGLVLETIHYALHKTASPTGS